MKRQSVIQQPNCLNTVRLLAALLILVGHAAQHLGIRVPQWMLWFVYYFRGVPIFFVLSGFLIWDSLGRNSLRKYVKNRFLRIYPELWCAVGVGLAVLLVLYRQPINWLQVGAFVLTQGSFLQFWTPDCLRGYGCGTPNGALWTIGIQVQFYILAWFAYRLLHNQKLWRWVVAMVVAVLISAMIPVSAMLLPTIAYKLLLQTLLPYGWLFLLGCLLAQYSDRVIPRLKRFWPLLLLAAAVVKLFGLDITAGYGFLHSTFLTVGVIGLAYFVPKANIRIDISYGVYIYHMIVINAMIALGFTGSWMYMVIAMLITCVLATISALILDRLRTGNNKMKVEE